MFIHSILISFNWFRVIHWFRNLVLLHTQHFLLTGLTVFIYTAVLLWNSQSATGRGISRCTNVPPLLWSSYRHTETWILHCSSSLYGQYEQHVWTRGICYKHGTSGLMMFELWLSLNSSEVCEINDLSSSILLFTSWDIHSKSCLPVYDSKLLDDGLAFLSLNTSVTSRCMRDTFSVYNGYSPQYFERIFKSVHLRFVVLALLLNSPS